MTSRAEALDAVARIADMFPDVRIDPSSSETWVRYLTSLPDASILLDVVDRVVCTSTSFPRFSSIRAAYSEEVERRAPARPDPLVSEEEVSRRFDELRSGMTLGSTSTALGVRA